MISFLKFTICSSVVCEDWRVLTELVPVSFFEGGAERVAVVGAILSSQVRLSLNVVIWPSLETVILDLLVDPVTVLETVVSLSTEMVLVSVWDTDASEGGTTNWRVTDFNRRSDVGCGCADRSGGWRGFAGKSNHLSRVSTWQRSCFDFAVGGGGYNFCGGCRLHSARRNASRFIGGLLCFDYIKTFKQQHWRQKLGNDPYS